MEKKWNVAEGIDKKLKNNFPEINPIILQLLANRNITTQKAIDEFLNPDYGQDLIDPFLFKDMAKAVKKILKAIESKKKIVVYGDYDADGVTSSAILISLLEELGAKTDIYIPFRETEGYGLNLEAAKQIAKNGAELVITVDCGISNDKEIKLLKSKGIDTIVTDHHYEPLNLPRAYAIINHNLSKETYPFKFLAGCGVAYKLVQAIISEHKKYRVNQLPAGWEKWLLDLAAIGTVADMMPLIGENRVLVKYGLIVLRQTRRKGLQKLTDIMGGNLKNIDEQSIGWQISPRINAAGRMNHASSAYQLLITSQEAEAVKLAEELNKTNIERQQLTEKIQTEAKKLLGEVDDKKILIVVGKDWSTGLVGLVAGRLADKFNRPTLVISRFNDEIVGSGRSIKQFNIIQALEKNCHQFLSRYGGHSQACGFTVKDENNLEKFVKKMTEIADQQLKNSDFLPIIEIDAQIDLEQINWELFGELEKFIPFGEGNPKPKFIAKNLTVTDLQTVGQDGKHLRLMVRHNTMAVKKTIGFCFGDWCTKIKKGDKVDIVFEIDVNEWNGNRELQLKIIDLKISN